MKVAIVLPTFNEAENIENLVTKIHEINSEFEIVVVDDNSPDGTGEIIERLKKRNSHIHAIHRKNSRGRGTAGIVGFKECLKLEPDVVVEMDADFSHRPEIIPILLREIEKADVVIASRNVQGGKDMRDWIRRVVSRMSNLYIRIICGINIHDASSGFRAFRTSILKTIDMDKLKSRGPSIVQELLLKCLQMNAKIIEIPYTFYERGAGKSKLSIPLLLRTLFDVTIMGVRFKLGWD